MTVLSTLGRLGDERGHANERRALRAAQSLATRWPSWLRGLFAGTPEEDARGWDLVAHTDVGKIGVQIKSSKAGAARDQRKHPGVLVVVANHLTPEPVLGRRVISAISQSRDVYLAIRQESAL